MMGGRSFVAGFAVSLVLVAWLAASVGAAEPPRPCGGIEGFEILAGSPRTTCSFARATAHKVRYVAFHNGDKGLPHRFKVKVQRRQMSCRNSYRGRQEVIACNGRQRRVIIEYTSP